MRLTQLELEEFRSYRHLVLAIPSAGLRIVGRNASGKTSLLEAIYLLATARSPRTATERDLINWQSNEEYGLAPYARIQGEMDVNGHPLEIELTLAVDPERGGTRKRMKVDGAPRRVLDAVGTIRVVLFEPEDLDLVLGSPTKRRRYLDVSLSQLDPTYLQSLSRFGRLLQQRNSLLKDLGARRGRGTPESELAYWDEELVAYGSYLAAARERYVARLSANASAAFDELASGGLRLGLRYLGSVELTDALRERVVLGSMTEAQALLGRGYGETLRARRDEELRRGVTLVGPHRDDVTFTIDARDLSAFGSRGQQRLAVVAVKLAELRTMLELSDDRPILLLDDVLSELDTAHRDLLLGAVGRAECQVLVTSTERSQLEHPALEKLPLVELSAGAVVGP